MLNNKEQKKKGLPFIEGGSIWVRTRKARRYIQFRRKCEKIQMYKRRGDDYFEYVDFENKVKYFEDCNFKYEVMHHKTINKPDKVFYYYRITKVWAIFDDYNFPKLRHEYGYKNRKTKSGLNDNKKRNKDTI